MSSTGVARIAGIDPFTSFKAPCTVATTANITLSGAQTIDGVAVAETTPKTRVLVKDQTDQTENGIYDVYDTAWVRSDDFNGTRDVTKGTMINIQSGTSWIGVTFRLTTTGTVVFGTSSITFESANPANSTTVIGKATLDTYAELMAINTGQYSNGDIIYLAGSGISGNFRLVNSVAHGITSIKGVQIRINDDWYAQRTGVVFLLPEWFGCAGDYSPATDTGTDDTGNFQNCIDSAASLYLPIHANKKYLITDTLSVPEQVEIVGNKYYNYSRAFGVDPQGTFFSFKPSTARPFLQLTGTSHAEGFRFHNAFKYFHVSADNVAATGSIGMYLDGLIYGNIESISLQFFDDGIKCNRTINNSFRDVLIINAESNCVHYEGNIETTDVWDHCSFFSAPVAVYSPGTTVSIRFTNCVLEQIDDYVANVARETQNMIFTDCYVEDGCFSGDATSAVFRVGYLGTTLAATNQLTVCGGTYQGRNAGTAGSFIDADYCTGALIANVPITRFTNGIKASSNTVDNGIVLNGVTYKNVTNQITDTNKITGMYAHSAIGAGNGMMQNLRVRNITAVNTITAGNFVSGFPTLVTTSVALTNGAGANTATLTNSPVTGNPTKWVPINDNGTTRYVPVW